MSQPTISMEEQILAAFADDAHSGTSLDEQILTAFADDVLAKSPSPAPEEDSDSLALEAEIERELAKEAAELPSCDTDDDELDNELTKKLFGDFPSSSAEVSGSSSPNMTELFGEDEDEEDPSAPGPEPEKDMSLALPSAPARYPPKAASPKQQPVSASWLALPAMPSAPSLPAAAAPVVPEALRAKKTPPPAPQRSKRAREGADNDDVSAAPPAPKRRCWETAGLPTTMPEGWVPPKAAPDLDASDRAYAAAMQARGGGGGGNKCEHMLAKRDKKAANMRKWRHMERERRDNQGEGLTENLRAFEAQKVARRVAAERPRPAMKWERSWMTGVTAGVAAPAEGEGKGSAVSPVGTTTGTAEVVDLTAEVDVQEDVDAEGEDDDWGLTAEQRERMARENAIFID